MMNLTDLVPEQGPMMEQSVASYKEIKEPAIQQALTDLHAELDQLAEITSLLIDRLRPVSMEETPTPAAPLMDRPGQSPIIGKVSDAQQRVALLRASVHTALARLEI